MKTNTKHSYAASPMNEAMNAAIEESGLSQAEICRNTGIPQASLTRFIHKQKGLSSENSMKLRVFLNDFLPDDMKEKNSAIIHRMGTFSPRETISGDGLPRIPVWGFAGAGNPVELFGTQPITTIEVLPQYNVPGVVAFEVSGDSMEPSIHKGAYVGVVPFSGEIEDGGIYLVQKPPFGRTVKRIHMGKDGGIVLHSDNAAYPPVNLPFEGYENIVLGKVVWVWQYL